MKGEDLYSIFLNLKSIATEKFPDLDVELFYANNKNFPEERNFAMCSSKDENGCSKILVSSKILNEDRNTVKALLMHELAHAAFFCANCTEHTESATDQLAEVIFGYKIYYDDRDVQTIKVTNKSVRPNYLPR